MAPALVQIPLQLRFEALRQWLAALEFVSTDPRGQWAYEQFDALIAQTWQECSDILAAAKKYNRIVAVCHVLRYTPYFRKMKEIVDSGVLGQIVSVQHFEPVEHIH
ncbi:MAG: hypothetical protein ACEQR4_04580, partial [Rhodoluna sp.]